MKFKDKAWIYISLLTLVTALIWLGVSVRATLLKSTVPADTQAIIEPLDPTLDQTVFDNLKSRAIQ